MFLIFYNLTQESPSKWWKGWLYTLISTRNFFFKWELVIKHIVVFKTLTPLLLKNAFKTFKNWGCAAIMVDVFCGTFVLKVFLYKNLSLLFILHKVNKKYQIFGSTRELSNLIKPFPDIFWLYLPLQHCYRALKMVDFFCPIWSFIMPLSTVKVSLLCHSLHQTNYKVSMKW